jgi:hypothetical protein
VSYVCETGCAEQLAGWFMRARMKESASVEARFPSVLKVSSVQARALALG